MRDGIRQRLSLHVTLDQPLAMGVEGDTRLDLLLWRVLQMDVRVGEVTLLLSIDGLDPHEVEVEIG